MREREGEKEMAIRTVAQFSSCFYLSIFYPSFEPSFAVVKFELLFLDCSKLLYSFPLVVHCVIVCCFSAFIISTDFGSLNYDYHANNAN